MRNIWIVSFVATPIPFVPDIVTMFVMLPTRLLTTTVQGVTAAKVVV